MDLNDLQNRFLYHPPTPAKFGHFLLIRSHAFALAELLNRLAPDGREKSLAITRLEESVMWANAAIAREGSSSALPGSPGRPSGSSESSERGGSS